MSPSRDEIVAMIVAAAKVAKRKDEADEQKFGASSQLQRLPIIPHQIRSEDPTLRSPSFADFLEAFGTDSGPKFE